MAKKPKKTKGRLTLVEPIPAEPDGDDEFLRTLAYTIARELKLPADASVVGEPVQVTEISYRGNPRVGVQATCQRGGAEHSVGFGDVVFPPGTDGAMWSGIYRRWLSPTPQHGSTEEPARRPRESGRAEAVDVDLTRPVELIVLARKSRGIRCRIRGTDRELTLRTAVIGAAPGELITVLPDKGAKRRGHPSISGKLLNRRIDVPALGLVPLRLEPQGDWDPEEEYWSEADEPLPDWARPIVARGKRPAFEMEQVVPGADPSNWEADPIVNAVELKDAGERGAAEELLMKIVSEDLRCLDAHAHLGNFTFERAPRQAVRHYEIGVGIGELSLGAGFDGVLPWGLVDNRPFLRCLHGLGLCHWRSGDLTEAARIFTRILWLNPSDNQGERFNLADVQAGRSWLDSQEDGP